MRHGYEAMAEQSKPLRKSVMKEDKLTHLELWGGDWLHSKPIPFAQRGVHAPSCHAEAYSLVAEEEVADFQEIGQAEPIGLNLLDDPLGHRLQTGVLTA